MKNIIYCTLAFVTIASASPVLAQGPQPGKQIQPTKQSTVGQKSNSRSNATPTKNTNSHSNVGVNRGTNNKGGVSRNNNNKGGRNTQPSPQPTPHRSR